MATDGCGMRFDGSRLRQHWPALCASAWLVVCQSPPSLASDFEPIATAACPPLVLSSPWQPLLAAVAPVTSSAQAPTTIDWPATGPSSSWQAPVAAVDEHVLEAMPSSEVQSDNNDRATERVAPVTPTISESTATIEQDLSTLSATSVDSASDLENEEYLAAINVDLTEHFINNQAPPLPVLHAKLPPPEYMVTAPAAPLTAAASVPAAALIVTPYTPTPAALSHQLLPSIQHAYGLARNGAIFAARAEFIQVLRRIAQAKDAAASTDIHSHSLAAALRALDEADDFVPQGAQVEGELNVPLLVSVHRTPVLEQCPATPRPIEAIALYHEYARHQFARSVAGEQAGSAALYALGKMHNRLASGREGDVGHERQALVLFLASLDVAPGNYLAANEIGVILARGGRAWEASIMFRHAINVSPSATSYHNLAVVDRQLGYHDQASANEYYAQQLAHRDRAAGAASRTSGVHWVTPQEMGHAAQPLPIEAAQNWGNTTPQPAPQQRAPGQVETAAKWPQKLIPGVFRR